MMRPAQCYLSGVAHDFKSVTHTGPKGGFQIEPLLHIGPHPGSGL